LAEILNVHLQDVVVGFEGYLRPHDVAVMCECATDGLMLSVMTFAWIFGLFYWA
jgi:hypothetical protein